MFSRLMLLALLGTSVSRAAVIECHILVGRQDAPEPGPRQTFSFTLDADSAGRYLDRTKALAPFLDDEDRAEPVAAVARFLHPLSDRQKLVVILLEGLDGEPPRTYTAVSQTLGVTLGVVKEQLAVARIRIERTAKGSRYATIGDTRVRDEAVTELQLDGHQERVLYLGNFKTVRSLTEATEEELLELKSAGPHLVAAVKAKLALRGKTIVDLSATKAALSTMTADELQQQPVRLLDLNPRSRKRLADLSITTVGALVERTAEEIKGSRFGFQQLANIRAALRVHRLRLRGD